MCLAAVDDDGLMALGGQGNLGTKDVLLGGDGGLVVVVVKADFADGNHAWVLCELT